MTVQQISSRLGLHPETIRRWIRAGKLSVTQEVKYGEYEIPEESLKVFLEAHPKYKEIYAFTGDDKPLETVLLQMQNRLQVLERVNQNLEQQFAFAQSEIANLKLLLHWILEDNK